MSKMSEMSVIIEALRAAAATVSQAADQLAHMFSADDGPVSPKEQTTGQQTLKLEDVRGVMADMSRKGFTAQIRGLLLKYGADRLSAVDPADYPALLKDVEELENAG